MTQVRDAEYWRRYRLRKKERAAGKAAQPERPPAAVPAPQVAVRAAEPIARGRAVQVDAGIARRLRTAPALPRRVPRVKSDQEIRSHIATAMRTYGGNGKALLHVLTGYVTQLQEHMKRDLEDQFAERACEGLHPGKLATGVYCKLCHDHTMAATHGSLPPEFSQKKKEEAQAEDDSEFDDLDDPDEVGEI